MKKLLLALLLAFPLALLSSSGPEARQFTDPKSVISQPNPQARPIPVVRILKGESKIVDAVWATDFSSASTR